MLSKCSEVAISSFWYLKIPWLRDDREKGNLKQKTLSVPLYFFQLIKNSITDSIG